MHIMDGLLSPLWVAVWFAIAIPFLIVGVAKIARRRREDPTYMSMLAFMGVVIFILSVWHIPVPVTGSCSHPCGVALSAIIVGPFESVVLAFIALFFQMFLAHGGLTTLGANTVSLGVVGGFIGYGVYVALRRFKAPIWLSAGAAGFMGDIATYLTTAGQLALSLYSENFVYHWGLLSLGFMPTQLPLAIVESIITAIMVKYIVVSRPEVLRGVKRLG
ncbi:MAG: energy-coupling factor ABC transporter permease [Candidatus Nezhaarchaeales archaeon]